MRWAAVRRLFWRDVLYRTTGMDRPERRDLRPWVVIAFLAVGLFVRAATS